MFETEGAILAVVTQACMVECKHIRNIHNVVRLGLSNVSSYINCCLKLN